MLSHCACRTSVRAVPFCHGCVIVSGASDIRQSRAKTNVSHTAQSGIAPTNNPPVSLCLSLGGCRTLIRNVLLAGVGPFLLTSIDDVRPRTFSHFTSSLYILPFYSLRRSRVLAGDLLRAHLVGAELTVCEHTFSSLALSSFLLVFSFSRPSRLVYYILLPFFFSPLHQCLHL